MQNKVAILYICTAKYVVFWEDFFKSYEQYFLTNSEKHYYVFTDAEEIYGQKECDRIHKFYQESLGWPDNTLKRFHIFSKCFEELEKYDYVFFMNANCQCMSTITEDEFLPIDKELLVVQHPGFFNRPNNKFTYDRNPRSLAYIPKGEGKYYICGGVNGGKGKAFVQLMRDLMHNIDVDEQNGVIALWHDESHINRYILDRDDYRLLTPAYCYSEEKNLPFEKKILVRDKRKWIDVDTVKNIPWTKRIKDGMYRILIERKR